MRPVNTFAAIVPILSAVVAACTAHDPFSQPGETWIGSGPGPRIHLLTSHRYAARLWSDIGVIDLGNGKWSETGDSITLTPSKKGSEQRRLLRMTVKGCQALVPPEAIDATGEINPFMTYFRKDDPCLDPL